MTDIQPVWESAAEYDTRLDLDATVHNLSLLTAPESGWRAVWDFLERKIKTADEEGRPEDARSYAGIHDEFFRGHFTYVALGYQEIIKDPERYKGHLLTQEESRQKIKSMKKRLARLKKKAQEMGIKLGKEKE